MERVVGKVIGGTNPFPLLPIYKHIALESDTGSGYIKRLLAD